MHISSHQSLHDKLQEIYECSQMAASLKNYLPVMAEFAKELFSSPFFEDFQKTPIEDLQNDLAPLLSLKEVRYKEVMAARELLVSYEQSIPVLSIYLQEFNELEKSRSPISLDLIEDLATVIKKACVCLTLKNQWLNTDNSRKELLLKLAKIDEDGQIIEYIFMPSQRLFREELAIFEHKKRSALWYSIHVLSQVLDLFDCRSFEKKHHSLLGAKQQYAAFFLEEDFCQFNEALETKDASNARFDVEECKVHMHRIWTSIKQKLLLSDDSAHIVRAIEPLTYRFTEANDLRQGILSSAKISLKLVGNSAFLLYLALKKKNISSDEAGDQLPDSNATPKERANNAMRVIKNNVLKKFGLSEYISSKYSIISVLYPTNLIE